MHEQRVVVQSPEAGESGAIRDAIVSMADRVRFSDVRAAVAYATKAGYFELSTALRSTSGWTTSTKRWLISIDFGHTEPDALALLAAVPHSEVRIPNGSSVVLRPRFRPTACFHPKVYAFGDQARPSLGLFSGSGNLTVNGLVTGYEAGVAQLWAPRLDTSQARNLRAAEKSLRWFERIWVAADPLDAVLPEYRRRWTRPPPKTTEDESELAELHRGTGNDLVSGSMAVQLATARALWVEAGNLYLNRGPSKPGNQLDLSPGTRVFFGFSPQRVPRNTIFGDLVLQCVGHRPVSRTMRLGNAQEKLNLPVPGSDGPASYDGQILLFERQPPLPGQPRRFIVRIGQQRALDRWKRAARKSYDYRMGSGRRYGLLF